MRQRFLLFFFFCTAVISAQDIQLKKVAVRDSIILDSTAIIPETFTLQSLNNQAIDSSRYSIDFGKALLKIDPSLKASLDTLVVSYQTFPSFLTKKYSFYDSDRIVNSTGQLDRIYKVNRSANAGGYVPFQGLNTSGSILRGVSIGNNQNSVLNSEP